MPMSLAAPPITDCTPLRSMRSVAARLGALLAPLRPSPGAAARARVLPVPLPFPCSLSRVVLSAARALPPPAAARLGAVPRPRPRSLPRAPRPIICAYLWALPLSPPAPRSALPWPAPCSACAPSPPSGITRQASGCRRSCGSVTPGGVRTGAGGQTGRGLPSRKAAVGGVRLGWAGVGVAGVGVGAVLRALRAPCCGCGGPRRGARGPRRGHPLRLRRAGGRGLVCRGRSLARWGCGLSPPCAWGGLPGARRQGLRPGRWGRSPQPALASRSMAQGRQGPSGATRPAARPAPLPPPAATPPDPRGSRPRIPWRPGFGSGTGGSGGRPAGGSHRSPTSLLSW